MEIRWGDKSFQIPNVCPIDAPRNRTLKRHLREHGVESLLTSKKLSEFAGCILDELTDAGAELVEPSAEVGSEETDAFDGTTAEDQTVSENSSVQQAIPAQFSR